VKETGLFYSPLMHLSSFCKISLEGRDYKISRLCIFDFSCYKTLLDLKNEIFKLDYYKTVPSPHHIRIFQNERLIKKNDSTLRKQNINTDCRLTVQVLDQPDNFDGNGFLLYLHKRQPSTKKFIQLGEYWWNGVSLEDLLIDLSKHSNIPIEFLLFATYELFYDRWVIFYNGVNEPERIKKYLEEKEKEIEEAKKTKKRRKVNRLFIKDATIVCLKDMREDPTITDDFAITQEAAQIFIDVKTDDNQSSGGGSTYR